MVQWYIISFRILLSLLLADKDLPKQVLLVVLEQQVTKVKRSVYIIRESLVTPK